MHTHATFADGPLAGPEHDRAFSSCIPANLWFTPQPAGDGPTVKDGWMLTALNAEPAFPHSGQVHYTCEPAITETPEKRADADASVCVVCRVVPEMHRYTIHQCAPASRAGYVVRAWVRAADADGEWRRLGCVNAPTLELARLDLPAGAWLNVGPSAEEDPTIVEVWI